MEAGEQLFTTWMTSTLDRRDHAVTDEEFAAHRPEPEAVCGVVVLAPMEWAPGPRCARCVAYLAARTTLPTLEQRLGAHRHRRPAWLARALRAVVPAQRSTSDPGGRGVTPAAASTGRHQAQQ
jgi:hypothetical protein